MVVGTDHVAPLRQSQACLANATHLLPKINHNAPVGNQAGFPSVNGTLAPDQSRFDRLSRRSSRLFLYPQ